MSLSNRFILAVMVLLYSSLFSYEFSSDGGSSKNNIPQAKIHVNSQRDPSPSNNWNFSAHIKHVPQNANMQRADYSVVTYASPALQNYFHHTITQHMYDATIQNHCCILPGYQLPHGLRTHRDQLSHFAGQDAALVSHLTSRLETYCNRIEAIIFSGKECAFCNDLSHTARVELVKIYANFLKEFYADSAPHIFYYQSRQQPLMQQVMPSINWKYFDGATVTIKPKTLEQRKAASILVWCIKRCMQLILKKRIRLVMKK